MAVKIIKEIFLKRVTRICVKRIV